MDIISIIEKYVEISVRKQKLEEIAKDAARDESYARAEGELAYDDGNFSLEQAYNTSARKSFEKKRSEESELSQIEQLLAFTHQSYLQAVDSMNEIELKEIAIKISVKAEDIQRKLDQLSTRRQWAKSKGDDAYARHNFQEEQEYNKISSDCYFEINKITPSLHYYNSFVSDLNYRATTKLGPKK